MNRGASGEIQGFFPFGFAQGQNDEQKTSLRARMTGKNNSNDKNDAAIFAELFGGFSVGLALFGGDLFGALLDGAHEGEENDVADGAGVGEEHGEAVDAYAFACGRWEAVAEGSDVVFVHLVGFVVALFLLVELVEEALALVVGVV